VVKSKQAKRDELVKMTLEEYLTKIKGEYYLKDMTSILEKSKLEPWVFNFLLEAYNKAHGEFHVGRIRRIANTWASIKLDTLEDVIQEGERLIREERELLLKLYLEEVTLEDLLKGISGVTPDEEEVQMLRDIQESYKLNDGVMNVLVYYSMLKTDMKLVKNYITKIASHWKRKGISDVEGAIALTKQEYKSYKGWKQKSENIQSIERERMKAIQSAINAGLDDEKLGGFVRSLFSDS